VIRKYGGRFITTGETVVAEGKAGKGAYVVIVEFPSMERAKAWLQYACSMLSSVLLTF
jgi:uncharacterized protein (DUF1330 family)